MNIPTLTEGRRGCGHRQPGGLYLMSDGAMETCSKLPVVLTICPVCGEGIRPMRGFRWIEPDVIVEPGPHGSQRHTKRCPLGKVARLGDRCGLIWIGEQFYSPESFTKESLEMGVSRRIAHVPRGFVIGETWVLCAHQNVVPCRCEGGEPDCPECDGSGKLPGIFTAFRPDRIEYVVKGDEEEEELEALVNRGITPVRVEHADELDLAARGEES